MGIRLKQAPEKTSIIEKVKAVYNPDTPVSSEIRSLPTMPNKFIKLQKREDEPQPRLHVKEGNGMTVSVGKIRPCDIFDIKLTTLSHNTILGRHHNDLI